MKINFVKMFRSPAIWAFSMVSFLAMLSCKTTEPGIPTNVQENSIETLQEEPEIVEKRELIISEKVEDSVLAKEYTDELILGDRRVKLKFWKKGGGLTLINLHDNENTSVSAARQVIDSVGGTLIELQHTGERNIRFTLNRTPYEFDPNRMFTDVGAEASLNRFGKMSHEAHALARSLANRIVDSLDHRMIVTLHNNSEDNYSSLSYLDEYKNDASEVYIHPNSDPDDFFFVTTQDLFDQFKEVGYNVVLQNNETMTDDGSLSVLAGKRGIPYVNVEAQHGHLIKQVEMLYVLMNILGD